MSCGASRRVDPGRSVVIRAKAVPHCPRIAPSRNPSNVPGATRTRGLQIRNLPLYPPELRGLQHVIYRRFRLEGSLKPPSTARTTARTFGARESWLWNWGRFLQPLVASTRWRSSMGSALSSNASHHGFLVRSSDMKRPVKGARMWALQQWYKKVFAWDRWDAVRDG